MADDPEQDNTHDQSKLFEGGGRSTILWDTFFLVLFLLVPHFSHFLGPNGMPNGG
jgi:hypothetical protein